MISNIYFLLGLSKPSSWNEVRRAYGRLIHSLEEDRIKGNTEIHRRVGVALERLSETYEHIKQANIRETYEHFQESPDKNYCRPRLGQLLVAAGLLTLDELNSCLEIQKYTKNEHVHVGRIMVAAGYLTEQQLNYYLRIQMLFRLPADHPVRWGHRLVELGLVSEDQLKVALIERKNTGCTLRQALINRGWLTAEVLDRIF